MGSSTAKPASRLSRRRRNLGSVRVWGLGLRARVLGFRVAERGFNFVVGLGRPAMRPVAKEWFRILGLEVSVLRLRAPCLGTTWCMKLATKERRQLLPSVKAV